MITEKLTDDIAGIKRTAEILKNGGIAAIPTETVYGLAASAFNDGAIAKIFAAKGRPQDNPLIVHIAEFNDLNELVAEIPQKAKELAERFWPGPLTIVFKKSKQIAKNVSAGLDTVAVRMPSNAVARAVIKESGLPLAAPSANLSGSPSPTSAEHVISDLDGKIDAVIISGDSDVGVESTVVSLSTTPPRLLRPGFVTAEQLKEILPDLVIDKAVTEQLKVGEKAESPGMMYKHYSPKTEVYLVEADSQAFCRFVNRKKNSVAVCFREDMEKIEIPVLCLGSSQSGEEQAKNLFTLLRECDNLKANAVYVRAPEKKGVGLAVYNRLIRAAGFKIIKPKTVIGLTGPSGAGKSSLRGIAEQMGYGFINCDAVARKATEEKDCKKELRDAFGEDVFDENGNLIRSALAKKAFISKEKTELLNRTIFPFINRLIEKEIEKSGNNKIILDAPTLYESGADRHCDGIIVITAKEEERLKRILCRDGITEADALLRLRAGKSDDFYKEKTEHIIYNNGSFTELAEKFKDKLCLLGGN